MFQERYSVWEKIKAARGADVLAEAVGMLQTGVPGSTRATLVTRHGVGHMLFVHSWASPSRPHTAGGCSQGDPALRAELLLWWRDGARPHGPAGILSGIVQVRPTERESALQGAGPTMATRGSSPWPCSRARGPGDGRGVRVEKAEERSPERAEAP